MFSRGKSAEMLRRGKRDSARWPDVKIKRKKNNGQKALFPKERPQKQSLTVLGWTKPHHLCSFPQHMGAFYGGPG